MSEEKEEIIALYNIMAQSINNSENKRVQTNALYSTLIVGMVAFTASNSHPPVTWIAFISLVISIIWYLHIEAYVKLARAKFKVIEALEKNLWMPIFYKEYEHLNQIAPKVRLTKLEKIIPIVVGSVSLFVIIGRVLTNLCPRLLDITKPLLDMFS